MSKSYISSSLRKLVVERANQQCEYCLFEERFSFSTFEIDHIIAEKHGGETDAQNLAYACSICNKFKGTDIASYDIISGQLTPLFNPRMDKWSEHFLKLKNGRLEGKTAVGRVTIRLLQFNRLERVKERQLLIQANLLQNNVEND